MNMADEAIAGEIRRGLMKFQEYHEDDERSSDVRRLGALAFLGGYLEGRCPLIAEQFVALANLR